MWLRVSCVKQLGPAVNMAKSSPRPTSCWDWSASAIVQLAKQLSLLHYCNRQQCPNQRPATSCFAAGCLRGGAGSKCTVIATHKPQPF
jgi:hypothetical protein